MRVGKHLKQLAGESAVYGVMAALAKGVGVLLIPLYTRVFTPTEYGIVSLIDVLIMSLAMFAILGMDSASARWFFDSNQLDDRKCTIGSWFWCQLAVSLVLTVLLVVLAGPVAELMCGSRRYSALVRLAALSLPWMTGIRVLGNNLRYQRRPWAASLFAFARMLTEIGGVVLFVLVFRQGVHGLYAGKLAAAVVMGIVSVLGLGAWIAPSSFSWRRLREMTVFGLPMVPAALALWVMASADRIILTMFGSIRDVGVYAVAIQLSLSITLITGAFSQAWGPFALSIIDQQEAKQVYAKVLDIYAFLGCILCTALALFAPYLLALLTTEAYYAAASCIGLLAFGNVLNGARFIAALGCGIAKTSLPNAVSIGVGAVANIALNFALIPACGQQGAAAATMTAYFLSVVYLFSASQKRYRIPYRWHVSLACFIFSWVLIAVNWLLFPFDGAGGFVMRAGLLLLFLPCALSLGVVKWHHFKHFLRHTQRLLIPVLR